MHHFTKKVATHFPPLPYCYRKIMYFNGKLIKFNHKTTEFVSNKAGRLRTRLLKKSVKKPRISIRYYLCLVLYKSGIIKRLPRRISMDLLANTLQSPIIENRKNRLIELQKDSIKSVLDPGKKTVAFCLTTRAYRTNLGNVMEKLSRQGKFNVITLIGEITGDKYERGKNVFYIPNENPDAWGSLDFIDLCVTVRAFHTSKPPAKIMNFLHDIHDSPYPDIENTGRFYLGFDYLFLASRFLIDRVKLFITEAKPKYLPGGNDGKTRCLIGGGYPKLERNIEYLEKHANPSRTIIFATTAVEGRDMQDLVVFPDYADKIVGAVLNYFTDYNLIFRPHPLTTHRPEVQEVARKFAGNRRFIYDNNAASYMENYAKSVLMITDMSGTAYTYALTTLRPVIFFLHNEPETLRRFDTYQYFKDMDKIGRIAHNIAEMIEQIKWLLASGGDYAARIKEYREATIYNLGRSEEYFVDNFQYIIEDKKHPDWNYL